MSHMYLSSGGASHLFVLVVCCTMLVALILVTYTFITIQKSRPDAKNPLGAVRSFHQKRLMFPPAAWWHLKVAKVEVRYQSVCVCVCVCV
jgi:hypothetical protein